VRTVTRGGDTGIEVANSIPLYVATPALLRRYGLDPHDINANTDIITSRTGLKGLVVTSPRAGPTPCDTQPGCRVNGVKPTVPAAPRAPYEWHPAIQTAKLPTYTSDPNALLTTHALRAFGLKPVAAGWLIQTARPLTASQINIAQHAAADAGIAIATQRSPASYSRLRNGATAVGLLVALGVLAMTVGLIRSETANDLRTLAATGATSTTRRTLTAATAGALALLGALLGTGGAYLALIAWHRSDLHPLTQVPFLDLAAIIVGLPLIAITAGWLLAGREPPTIAHQPLE
jgi:putative ABC transport system permease protein